MYYISLDEVGDFENVDGRRDNHAVFIAGVIYEAANKEECNREKKRIQVYLEAVCNSVGKQYPECLHVDKSRGVLDGDVKPVKQAVTQTLHDFLMDCDYPGKDNLESSLRQRQGKYFLYVYLYGQNGKAGRKTIAISEYSKDEFAGNLYLHMAEDVVARLLFHNPVIDDGSSLYHLDLATRKFVYDSLDRGHSLEEAKQYKDKFEKIGYKLYLHDIEKKIKNREIITQDDYPREGYVSFELTNLNNYWLSIERESFKSNKNIQLDGNRIQVRSIQYQSGKGNSTARSNGFLYLADLICSILGFQLSSSNFIGQFDERLKSLVENNYQLFIYDDCDTLYGDAILCLEEKNYYKFLSHLYEITLLKSDAARYYVENLINPLIESAKRELSIGNLYSAISRLSEFAYSNYGKRDMLLFIYKGLERIYQAVEISNSIDIEEWSRYSFELYDVGASAYTHNGDGKAAIECYKKCAEYFDYVSIEKMVINNNKLAVLYQDEFDYELSYQTAIENADTIERIYSSLQTVGCANGAIKRTYSKALSQFGQAASYLKYEVAEEAFSKALLLTKDDEKNYLITFSYYLHCLIEQKKCEEYKENASEYFETGDIKEQLNRIREEAKKTDGEHRRYLPEFALYIYLKAMYVFGMDIDDELETYLKDIDKYFKDINWGDKRHPWELIYKYLGLIMIKRSNVNSTRKYLAKLRMTDSYGDQIVRAIGLNSRIQVLKELGENYDDDMNELLCSLAYINEEKYGELSDKDETEQKNVIQEVFRYMYD